MTKNEEGTEEEVKEQDEESREYSEDKFVHFCLFRI
jgi:hypothetical protein